MLSDLIAVSHHHYVELVPNRFIKIEKWKNKLWLFLVWIQKKSPPQCHTLVGRKSYDKVPASVACLKLVFVRSYNEES